MRLAAAPAQVPPRSSLLPREGVAILADTPLPQRDLSAAARRRARVQGARLRSFAPLAGLSDTECTTLHHLLEPLRVAGGRRWWRVASPPTPSISSSTAGPRCATRRRLGPASWFGEIGLLTGGRRKPDVVAVTPLQPTAPGRRSVPAAPASAARRRRRAEPGRAPARRGKSERPCEAGREHRRGAAALRAAGARDRRLRGPDRLAERFVPGRLRLTAIVKVPLLRGSPRLAEGLLPGSYWFESPACSTWTGSSARRSPRVRASS